VAFADIKIAGSSQPDYQGAWPPLIEKKLLGQACELCEGWLRLDEVIALSEAHTCVANIDLK